MENDLEPIIVTVPAHIRQAIKQLAETRKVPMTILSRLFLAEGVLRGMMRDKRAREAESPDPEPRIIDYYEGKLVNDPNRPSRYAYLTGRSWGRAQGNIYQVGNITFTGEEAGPYAVILEGPRLGYNAVFDSDPEWAAGLAPYLDDWGGAQRDRHQNPRQEVKEEGSSKTAEVIPPDKQE